MILLRQSYDCREVVPRARVRVVAKLQGASQDPLTVPDGKAKEQHANQRVLMERHSMVTEFRLLQDNTSSCGGRASATLETGE